MNVIGSRPDGWWRDRRAAMRSLVGELGDFQRRTGDRVLVVFDGEAVPVPLDRDVEVAFAPGPGPNRADDEIVRRVRAHAEPGTVSVVTSDRELAERVRQAGAKVASAASFRWRLDDLRSRED